MNTEKCTIVTAYYELENKKTSSDEYYKWMANFLTNCQSYMIIFTDTQSYDRILNLRKDFMNNTKIIVCPIDNFYTYKYLEHWKKDILRDHEIPRVKHSIELYMIWNEKSMFLKKAIELNPFNTDYFCWSDIGMVRGDDTIQYIKEYPVIDDRIDKNKVYLLNIQYIFSHNDIFSELASERYRYLNAIGGTVFFGHKNVLLLWIAKYYEMLEEFVNKDYFAGKDQSLMACVYVKNSNMIKLIRPHHCPIGDPWFYMIYYLS